MSSPDIRHRFGDREAVAYRPFVDVSIVMPAHNEEVLLPASVDDVCRGLRSRGTRFELVVVENGSTDRTLGLAHELATANDEVRVLTRPEADYGAALRLGLLEATGDVVVNFDVDYYDLAFLDTAVTALGGPPAPAIVVGSKRAPGAHDRRSWPRRFVTWGFTTLLRMMFHIGVSDTHGMKAMAEPGRGDRPPLSLRRGPLRHRARDPRRARRHERDRDPGDGHGTASVAHVDPPAGAAFALGPRPPADRPVTRAHPRVTLVLASSALCPPGAPAPGWVAIDGDVIVEVGAGRPASGAVDVGDALLMPAFVDLQCNGVGDLDFATADAEAWRRARATLARHGVGAFCPTFVSAPLPAYDAMLTAAAAARSEPSPALAEVLGVHLEGPFLGAAYGAHDPAHVQPVDVTWLERALAGWPQLLRMVTLAPEADEGLRATAALVAAGVVVAIGHSAASLEEVTRAAGAGATVVTHVFNGMPPFHPREPGLVGAALTDERLTPTVIADLVHVHAAALRVAAACKPGIAAVSDAVAVGHGLVEHGGAAWTADGILAGATTLLDAALGHLLVAGIPVARAAAMVTAAPAQLVGAAERGVLRAGARADLVAFDLRAHEVAGVWLAGVPVAS